MRTIRRLFLTILSTWLTARYYCRAEATSEDYDDGSQKLLQACLGQVDDATTITLIRELLDNQNSVDVNVRDPVSGQTALMASVLRGKAQTVQLLLERGADATIPEKDGYLPPHGAAFQGRTDVMEVLHKHGLSRQEFHGDGYLPYHRACWGRTDRHATFVSYLLKEGIVEEVDVLSKDGKTCREMTGNPQTIDVLDSWTNDEL